MHNRTVEAVVGFFLCLGVAAILLLTFQVSDLQRGVNGDSYTVYANFENTGGLKIGSSVSMAGVNIGRVTGISIDEQTFESRVALTISNDYQILPKDSSASILTAGLLGEKYIGVEAGGDLKTLADGDVVKFTESALVLEQVIGQFLFQKASAKDE